MNRIAGLETEYGCLVLSDERQSGVDTYPIRVKSHLFKVERIGAIDLHYRDYEEPPGNGGFLLNGGRLYLDMGHIEYSTPECLSLKDIVAFERAGDALLQGALERMGLSDHVFFIKNNIDHHTGATFGCHENYLMKREAQFTPQVLAALLSFLATRQIFTGAGRVGQSNPLAFEFGRVAADAPIDFQISQRADHIVNDIYQWVQFNRAIINARDEPLADYRKYRRLHLLIGDSNVSEIATALKIGTTALVLDLLEAGIVPKRVELYDAVQATRDISRDQTGKWLVRLLSGQTRSAFEIQRAFLSLAQHYLAGADEETDWVLREWENVLDGLEAYAGNGCAVSLNHSDWRSEKGAEGENLKPELQDFLPQVSGFIPHPSAYILGRVDWVTKKWLLEQFMREENLEWDDPWLQSLDLEYHNLNPQRSLFHGLVEQGTAPRVVSDERVRYCTQNPPQTTRAQARGWAVRQLLEHETKSYVINWDSIAIDNKDPLVMGNPFHNYLEDVARLLKPPPPFGGA
jgi:proteasome accessory factor A